MKYKTRFDLSFRRKVTSRTLLPGYPSPCSRNRRRGMACLSKGSGTGVYYDVCMKVFSVLLLTPTVLNILLVLPLALLLRPPAWQKASSLNR